MTELTHKVRIKIGANEFEAEGDKATVEEQARQFFALMAAAPAAPVSPAGGAASQQPPSDPGANNLGVAASQAAMDGAFQVEGDLISLRVLPKSQSYAADTLLMLLYGHKVMRDEGEVLGGKLMKEARQSGLKIDRVDRVIDLHSEFIIKGGARKGARYGLNNRGIAKAKEMLEKLRE